MKISLSVEHPREAGYATLMFKALQVAMLADPPPLPQVSHSRVGDVSHSVLTGGVTSDVEEVLHPIGGAEADAAGQAGQQISPTKQTAVEILDAEKAAAERKKPGRKSNAEKEAAAAAAAAAKAAGQENALRPGDALKGVSAQTLAAALEGMPLVHESDGVQVRVAPDTPLDEIAAMKGRLEEQTKAADAKAAAQASAGAEAKSATVTSITQAGAAAGGMDDDLASLFRKKAPETPPPSVTAGVSRFVGMTGPQLMKEFTGYINGDGGLFWARAVMAHYSIEALDDLTEAQIRDALENPGQFKPAAA